MSARTRLGVVAAALAAVAASFVAGRYSRPARVEVRTQVWLGVGWQTREVERVVWRERTQRTAHVERRTETRPDGSSVTTVVSDTRAAVDSGGGTERYTESAGHLDLRSESIRTEDSRPRYSLGGGVQLRLSDPTRLVPELAAGLRLLGPVWLRASATVETRPQFGLRLDVEW